MHLRKILLTSLLWVIFPATVSMQIAAYCDFRDQGVFCAKQRGDSRCNDSSECCGVCNSFGYCERRR